MPHPAKSEEEGVRLWRLWNKHESDRCGHGGVLFKQLSRRTGTGTSKPNTGGRDRAVFLARTYQNDARALLGSTVLCSHKVTDLARDCMNYPVHASVLQWSHSKRVAISIIPYRDIQCAEWPTRRFAEFPHLGQPGYGNHFAQKKRVEVTNDRNKEKNERWQMTH